MTSGVYKIINTVSGHTYVGKTTRLKKRFNVHRSKLRNGIHHCAKLQADWIALGEEAFRFDVHAELPAEDIGRVECELIQEAQAEGSSYNVAASQTDGRPPLPEAQRLVARTMCMKPAHWEFIRAGGWQRFREKIDGWDPLATVAEQEAHWAEP